MNNFDENISYFYHRSGNYDITVAYQRSKLKTQVRFGAAFCGPQDEFRKKLGRRVAEGRMIGYTHVLHELEGSGRWETHENILNALEMFYEYSPEGFRSRK